MTTRDAVLNLLKKNGGTLSGETIGEMLGISRAAVNGAIRSLREEGYGIASATRRGYCLESAPDLLTTGELLSCLDASRMERVVCLDSVDSTNRYLAQLALDGAPDGQVVIADCQTAGRGRLSRGFHSPAGRGVYYSYLIRPGVPWRDDGAVQEALHAPEEKGVPRKAAHAPGGTDLLWAELTPDAWTRITSMTAVAVSDAVEAVCGVRPRIKWVNDLCLGDKKICGILTQMDMEPDTGHVRSLVIGIGVNVRHRMKDFPDALRDIAGSVYTETGKEVSRAQLAAEMTRAMDRMRTALPDASGAYLKRYREASILPGMDVTVISGETKRPAHALFIADDYALRVRYEDGTEEDLRGGEVSIRRRDP